MNILVVDDEYYTRKALAKIIGETLRLEGFASAELREFGSAEEVLEQLNTLRPDVVFADIRMGDIDGIELCERLHAHDPGIRLVVVSGYAEFGYAQKAIRCNVTAYLTKPVDEGDIAEIVRTLAAAPSPAPAPPQPPPGPEGDGKKALVMDSMTRKLVLHYLDDLKPGEMGEALKKQLCQTAEKRSLAPADYASFLRDYADVAGQYLARFPEQDATLPAPPAAQSLEESLAYIESSAARLGALMDQWQTREQGLAQRVTEYIQEHYSENITLYDLASAHFYVHPNYLSKIIKTHTGQSFSKYLLDVRMEHARALLAQDLSISVVAQLIGYNSTSHFVQVFKRYVGHTPGSL